MERLYKCGHCRKWTPTQILCEKCARTARMREYPLGTSQGTSLPVGGMDDVAVYVEGSDDT